MTRSAVVDSGMERENRVLRRYATERMTNAYEVSFRKIHRCVVCRTAEQKLHRTFGKQFRPRCKKNAVMDAMTGAGGIRNFIIPAQSPNNPSLSTAATP